MRQEAKTAVARTVSTSTVIASNVQSMSSEQDGWPRTSYYTRHGLAFLAPCTAATAADEVGIGTRSTVTVVSVSATRAVPSRPVLLVQLTFIYQTSINS